MELGITHHREGRLRDAEQIYRQILSAQPNNPDALHLLGVILGQTGQPQLAIDHITRAIKLQPGVPDYHANLGEYLRHAGKLDQSAVSFRQAIAMNANVPLYHNGLGVTLAKSQQFEPAIAEFRIAIQLKADYADAHKNLAGASAKQDAWKNPRPPTSKRSPSCRMTRVHLTTSQSSSKNCTARMKPCPPFARRQRLIPLTWNI